MLEATLKPMKAAHEGGGRGEERSEGASRSTLAMAADAHPPFNLAHSPMYAPSVARRSGCAGGWLLRVQMSMAERLAERGGSLEAQWRRRAVEAVTAAVARA